MPTPEDLASQTIEAQLRAAGWAVQSLDELNKSEAHGLAVCEMQFFGGPADDILFVDIKSLGVVEAKKAGTTLSGVADQSARYTHARKWIPQCWCDSLLFTHESTGIETNFRDQRSRFLLSPINTKSLPKSKPAPPPSSTSKPNSTAKSPAPTASANPRLPLRFRESSM